MVDAPSSFPLAWPPGRPRTPYYQRQKGTFSTKRHTAPGERGAKPLTMADARERLARECDLLRARLPILSSNVQLRLDGRPYSGQPEPGDSGVAVYFQLDGKPIALACDRYTEVAQNVAAIAAHIDASRRIERYGVATTAQMFTGFLALPAPLVVDDWRSALGNPTTLAEAETAFRERIRTAHPDAGGSHAQAAALTEAIRLAREALK
jgi:hypothetical protein